MANELFLCHFYKKMPIFNILQYLIAELQRFIVAWLRKGMIAATDGTCFVLQEFYIFSQFYFTKLFV